MKLWIAQDVARTLIVLAALAAARVTLAVWDPSIGATGVGRVVRTLSNRDLNKEAREALTAGYYEGLINEGSRVSGMSRLLTGTQKLDWSKRESPERQRRPDFLYYELKPNVELPDYADGRGRYVLHTNSFGMADREYSRERAAGTRRIALLGDSIARGQGAPFGGNFESLLEDRLNEAHTSEAVRSFEILNFAVGGYNITQVLDVTLEKVPAFQPDVYMVALSDLSVFRRWAHHIALLTYEGIDLKYDYLRQLSRDAALDRDDPIGTFDAKLARFRIPTLRWALGEMRAHATRQGAEFVVVLVPTVDDASMLAEEFLGVRQMLDAMGISTIDLLQTFSNPADHPRLRVSHNDRHPNAHGHRLLFEKLYEALLSRPELAARVLGTPGGEAVAAARR